ncbi:MAG: LPS export ABC transporter periplasmic protein LptC [Syntrophobacterales bacterium]|nr:LPS export ABC transporter periplasmic protein LptC [Syntrophobacterales bacterium]
MIRKGILLVGISATALVAIFYGVWSKKGEDPSWKEHATSQPLQSSQPASEKQERGIKLEGIKYTEVSEDGQSRWKIVAREVEVFINEKKSLLDDVYVEFYTKNGKVIKLTANKGTFFAGVKDIEVYGNVTVTFPDGMVLKTEKATYKNKDKELSTEGYLDFSSKTLSGRVGRCRYNLDNGMGYGEDGIFIKWRTGVSSVRKTSF